MLHCVGRGVGSTCGVCRRLCTTRCGPSEREGVRQRATNRSSWEEVGRLRHPHFLVFLYCQPIIIFNDMQVHTSKQINPTHTHMHKQTKTHAVTYLPENAPIDSFLHGDIKVHALYFYPFKHTHTQPQSSTGPKKISSESALTYLGGGVQLGRQVTSRDSPPIHTLTLTAESSNLPVVGVHACPAWPPESAPTAVGMPPVPWLPHNVARSTTQQLHAASLPPGVT